MKASDLGACGTASKLAPKKKILVVTTWSPDLVGGPQNLSNLLSQLAPDSYCVLTTRLSTRGRRVTSPLPAKYFYSDDKRRSEQQHISHMPRAGETLAQSERGLTSRLVRFLTPFLPDWLRGVASAPYSLLSIWRIANLGCEIVRERSIDCVIGISDHGPALIGSYLIARRTGKAYVPYLFDIYFGNKFRPFDTLLARIYEPRILKSASIVVLTNEGTEQYYRRRYGDGLRFTILYNSVFPDGYDRNRTSYRVGGPYVILYTGMVYWAQERSLMNLIKAYELMKERNVRVELYVPNPPASLKHAISGMSGISLHSATPSEMPGIQCGASVLFLPLSWGTKSPDVIATASPGKLADYLASGRPILIHAPPYAWLNEYARKNRFALVVDTEDTTRLKDSLVKLMEDVKYARKLINNAMETFRKNHDARTNVQKFIRILDSI